MYIIIYIIWPYMAYFCAAPAQWSNHVESPKLNDLIRHPTRHHPSIPVSSPRSPCSKSFRQFLSRREPQNHLKLVMFHGKKNHGLGVGTQSRSTSICSSVAERLAQHSCVMLCPSSRLSFAF